MEELIQDKADALTELRDEVQFTEQWKWPGLMPSL